MNDLHDLVPVDRAEFFEVVAPCLTLAAGVGMSQSDQDAWLEAAFQALDGIPIRLLQKGASAARLSADHPSKIIPAIMAEIEADWRWRRENQPGFRLPPDYVPPPPEHRSLNALMDSRGRPMTAEETERLNKHLELCGSCARYRMDGSRHTLEETTP